MKSNNSTVMRAIFHNKNISRYENYGQFSSGRKMMITTEMNERMFPL